LDDTSHIDDADSRAKMEALNDAVKLQLSALVDVAGQRLGLSLGTPNPGLIPPDSRS
jgi:hypothetical protein